jgi:hypothetical protein
MKNGVEKGVDGHGFDYKRAENDFGFRRLGAYSACSVCHGTGAIIEFSYVTRNYQSPRTKKICKTLQEHEHSFWICPACADNMIERGKGILKITIESEEKQ